MKKLLKNCAVFAALVFALVVGMASCNNNTYENYDPGTCTDVTSLDDLLGTWRFVYKYSEEDEYYNAEVSEEGKVAIDYKITKEDDSYICKVIYKAGMYNFHTEIYKTSLTEGEFNKKKAEAEEEKEENEYGKCTYTLTKDKYVYKWEIIKDEEVLTYPLEIEDGKCYCYEEEEKEYYIKINEAKNGIQIFYVHEYNEDKPDYTCKKL